MPKSAKQVPCITASLRRQSLCHFRTATTNRQIYNELSGLHVEKTLSKQTSLSAFSDGDEVFHSGIRYANGLSRLKLLCEAYSLICLHWISGLCFALNDGTSEADLDCRVHTTTLVCVGTSFLLIFCSTMSRSCGLPSMRILHL